MKTKIVTDYCNKIGDKSRIYGFLVFCDIGDIYWAVLIEKIIFLQYNNHVRAYQDYRIET